MNEEELDTMEEGVEDIPEEAKDFIFGDGLAAVKNELATYLDTEEQRTGLSNMIMFFLLEGKTGDELNTFIDRMTIAPEKKLSIKGIIQDKIIDEISAIIDANQEIEDDSTGKEKTSTTSASTPLSSLADRLKQASIATPVKRDYSIAGATEAPASKPAIDPYHEPIDNV